ncbi:hypothetical protein O0L34_g5001 [Tuta absoluta]|nr:hypothetical protein O0L34_g5001 [Tuta absoluta]
MSKPESSLKIVDIHTLPRGKPLEVPLHPKSKRKWTPAMNKDEHISNNDLEIKNLNNRIKYTAPKCTITGGPESSLKIVDIHTLPRGKPLEVPLHPKSKRKWTPAMNKDEHISNNDLEIKNLNNRIKYTAPKCTITGGPESSLKIVDIHTLPRGKPLEVPLHPKSKRKWTPATDKDEHISNNDLEMKNLNNRIKYTAPKCTITGGLKIVDISTLLKSEALEKPLHPRKRRKWRPDYGANQNTVKKNEVKSQADRKDVDTLEAKDAQEPQNNAPSVQFRCPIMQSPPGRVRTRGGMSQTSSPRKPKWNEDEKEVDVNRLDMEPMDEQNPPNNVPSNQSSIGSIAQSPRGRVRTRGGTSQTSSPRKPKWDGDFTNLNVTALDFLDVIVLADQNEVINVESIDISNSSKHAPDDVSSESYPVEVFDVTEVEESNSSTQTISQVQSPNSMVQYEDQNNIIKLNAADAQEEQNGCPSTSPTAFAESSKHLECANTRTSVLKKILEQSPEKKLKISPRTPAKTPKDDHSSVRYLKSGRNLPLKKRVQLEDCVENKTIASTKTPEHPRRYPRRSHRRPSGVRHLESSKKFQPRTPPKPPVNRFNSELIKCIQNCSSTPKKTPEQSPNDEKPKRRPANTPLKKCGKSPRCVKLKDDDGVRSLTSSLLKSPEKCSTSSLLKTLSKCLKLAKASGEKPSGFRPRQLLWDRNEDTERKVPNGLNDSERNAVTELESMPKNDGSNSFMNNHESSASTTSILPEHTSHHEQTQGEIMGSLLEPTQNAKNMENIHYGSESEDSDGDEEELVPMIVPRAYRVGLNDSFQDDDEKLDLPAAPAMDVGSPAVALAKDLEGALYSSSLFPRK